MKLANTDKRVLMAVLVIASIGGIFAVAQGSNLFNSDSKNPYATGALLTGNVKVFQYDEDGNLLAYRQTDNHIVMRGMELIMAQVFRGMNSTVPSPAGPGYSTVLGLPHPVQYMQIGVGGEHRLLHNNTDIAQVATCTIRQSASILNATGAHKYPAACAEPNCAAQMNVTAVANFEGDPATDNCSSLSIDEAGIFDNSTATTLGMYDGGGPDGGGYMFARNTFGKVDLGTMDTLQLQWEFTFTDALP